jgi:hypothetical protein
MGVGVLLRQKHQILGRAHQEAVVARRALQRLPGIGSEKVQLRADPGDQPADGSAVIVLDLLQGLKGNDLIPELPDGLSVLDQCCVIHVATSRFFFIFWLQYTAESACFP